MRNHAKDTHSIYEDVSRVLLEKTKEEQKVAMGKMRQEMESEWQAKMSTMDNTY